MCLCYAAVAGQIIPVINCCHISVGYMQVFTRHRSN